MPETITTIQVRVIATL